MWMRKVSVCVAFALSIAAMVTAAVSAKPPTAPTLRLVTSQPLTVRGDGFRGGERVTVTAITVLGLPKRRVVRSTSRGRFGVAFRFPAQPCGRGFAVRAIGRLGSRAALMVPGRACVPPPVD